MYVGDAKAQAVIVYRATGPVFWARGDVQRMVYDCAKLRDYLIVVVDFGPCNWLKKICPNCVLLTTNPYDWRNALSILTDFRKDTGIEYVGIITFSEETYLQYAKCADALRLVSPSIRAAGATSANKINMKEALSSANIKTPKFVTTKSIDELELALFTFDLPCVIKPAIGGGSIGVYLIDEIRDIQCKLGRLRKDVESKMDITFINEMPGYLAEEYVSGNVISVDGVVDGKVRVYGMTDTLTSQPPFFFQEAAFSPPELTEPQIEICQETAIKAVRAIGLDHSAFHCELVFSECEGPHVIEIAGRSPGGFLPEIYKHVYGTDLIDEIVEIALGQVQPLASDMLIGQAQCFAIAGSFFYNRLGIIDRYSSIEGMKECTTLKNSCCLPKGSKVRHFGHSVADALFVGEKGKCLEEYRRARDYFEPVMKRV